jgi:hypothetical protein
MVQLVDEVLVADFIESLSEVHYEDVSLLLVPEVLEDVALEF